MISTATYLLLHLLVVEDEDEGVHEVPGAHLDVDGVAALDHELVDDGQRQPNNL